MLVKLPLCAILAEVGFSRRVFAQVDPTCPLDCKGHGSCVRGNADFVSTENSMPFLKDRNNGGYFCRCPAGRTGLTCEREYELCGDGTHICFHGGACLSGVKDSYGNEKHYCDCGNAFFDGKAYAGRFCEAEAVDICASAAEYGNVFCVNGGKCRADFLDYLDKPCMCLGGFEGPHCEYQSGEKPECDLHCLNGGSCRIGSKTYPPNQAYEEFWESRNANRYCVCKPGFFGLQCEIEGESCGDEHCFNGALCVTREMSNGATQRFCDCTRARAGGFSYAGLNCEVKSTSFCTKMQDHNGHQFCANGGSCKADSHLGCDCLVGFYGPVCEFRDWATVGSECTLKCEHNGVCRNGAKDVGFLKKFDIDLQKFDESFQHCVCSKGYVGIQCEHIVDVCPGGEHVCMNGAQCIPDGSGGRLRYTCNCDSIHTSFTKYAGDFCELKSSELCTFNGRPGSGQNKDAFCVNGGRCKGHATKEQSHPGCHCLGGFEGSHCERLSREGEPSSILETAGNTKDERGKDDTEESGKSGLPGVAIIVVFLSLVAFGVIGCRMRVRRQQRDHQINSVGASSLSRQKTISQTLGRVLSRGTVPDNKPGNSQMVSSRRGVDCKNENDGGLARTEFGFDLVNVAII